MFAVGGSGQQRVNREMQLKTQAGAICTNTRARARHGTCDMLQALARPLRSTHNILNYSQVRIHILELTVRVGPQILSAC